jgi:hypothetical protein
MRSALTLLPMLLTTCAVAVVAKRFHHRNSLINLLGSIFQDKAANSAAPVADSKRISSTVSRKQGETRQLPDPANEWFAWRQDHCQVEIYTAAYSNLVRMFESQGEAGLASHYSSFGRQEGRICNTSCIERYRYELPPRIAMHTGPSNAKLNVLVPMRGREEHLRKFIPAFMNSMKYNGIEARIFVVEQMDEGEWLTREPIMRCL